MVIVVYLVATIRHTLWIDQLSAALAVGGLTVGNETPVFWYQKTVPCNIRN